MKKVLVCGMLLGLLTTLSWAQRERTVVGPAARMGGVGPAARIGPNSLGIPPHGIAPNARTAGTATTVRPNATAGKATTVRPNATNGGAAKTVRPNVTKMPNKVILPDADGINGRTVIPPQ